MYKQLLNIDGNVDTTVILRKPDNASIPTDPDNKDYQEYLEWLAEGNTPEEVE